MHVLKNPNTITYPKIQGSTLLLSSNPFPSPWINRDLPYSLRTGKLAIGHIAENINVIYHSTGFNLVLHTFTMSTEQWAAMEDRTKAHKVSGTLRSAWGKAWCVDKGVEPTDEGMMRALNTGILSWETNVIQCIGYDVKLVQQLLKA